MKSYLDQSSTKLKYIIAIDFIMRGADKDINMITKINDNFEYNQKDSLSNEESMHAN